jgi:nucleoside-diphosphate-sugar epimerase
MPTRREFLKAALAGGAVLAGRAALAGGKAPAGGRTVAGTGTGAPTGTGAGAAAQGSLLLLGGTGFIGPHLVRLAVARGHAVTIFTRGRRTPDLPDGIERLVGDRNGQLGALEGRRWDAVVDDSATNPDWVAQSAKLLRDAVGRYLFTSSTGVYYPYLARGLDESTAPHLEVANKDDGSETYGVSKALCERTVLETFGERGLVVRPTYIVGPGDTTDRFPYWPVRFAQGGEILAPGRRDDPVQFVDVRDLAAFMLRLVETRRSGTFNVAGPRRTMTARAFYTTARRALNHDAQLTFVEDYAFLKAQGIEYSIPWSMLEGNDAGMMSIDARKAIDAGLDFRPIEETLRDTLAWWPSVPEDRRAHPKFAITPEIEARALAAWRAQERSAAGAPPA